MYGWDLFLENLWIMHKTRRSERSLRANGTLQNANSVCGVDCCKALFGMPVSITGITSQHWAAPEWLADFRSASRTRCYPASSCRPRIDEPSAPPGPRLRHHPTPDLAYQPF